MRQPSEQLLKLFGQNVIRLRGIAGFTQEKLAEQAQISWRYFQSIEAGKRYPSVGVLVRLRKALNFEWADLFQGLDSNHVLPQIPASARCGVEIQIRA